MKGKDARSLQEENQNLQNENSKLQEQIRLLREQLRQAGIPQISKNPEADPNAFNKLNLDLTKASEFLETIKTEGDKFGIIKQVHEDDKAVFNHQTYAEYFARVWFKRNLDKVKLLKDHFFSKKYQKHIG